MNSYQHKNQKHRSQSAANSVVGKQTAINDTFQFVDNRPESIIQQKMLKNTIQNTQLNLHKNIAQLKLNSVVQLGKYKKSSDDSGDEWKPPSERRKHRHTFSKKTRRKVISKSPRNKSGLRVCPGCGMPLADRKGREIKTYYISKSKKRHNIVSGQLDHYPPWAGRLKKLKAKRKSAAAIRADHDDPTRLRPLCRRCNQSHKFEKTKKLPDSGFSDEEYYSDDEARDKEIWSKFRKHDDDSDAGAGAGAGITA